MAGAVFLHKATLKIYACDLFWGASNDLSMYDEVNHCITTLSQAKPWYNLTETSSIVRGMDVVSSL